MKTLKNFMLIAVIAIMAVSCGDSKSQVDRLISYFEDLGDQISGVTYMTETEAIIMEWEDNIKAEFGNSNYLLSDADREKIVDATIKIRMLIGDKYDIDMDGSETARTRLLEDIKRCDTLGEFVTF